MNLDEEQNKIIHKHINIIGLQQIKVVLMHNLTKVFFYDNGKVCVKDMAENANYSQKAAIHEYSEA